VRSFGKPKRRKAKRDENENRVRVRGTIRRRDVWRRCRRPVGNRSRWLGFRVVRGSRQPRPNGWATYNRTAACALTVGLTARSRDDRRKRATFRFGIQNNKRFSCKQVRCARVCLCARPVSTSRDHGVAYDDDVCLFSVSGVLPMVIGIRVSLMVSASAQLASG